MQILKVWDSEYPWDVRAEKVCAALTGFGHEVHMVARNRDRRSLQEVLDECVVHRMRPLRTLGGSLDRASQFPAFFNPRWTGLMRRTARAQGVQVILVRDLPLAPAAVRVGREIGVPVVLDMAENYPAMIRDLWTTKSTRFGDFVVRNPRLVEWVERSVLRQIDHVIVVVEESRDRLIRLGVPEDRITVVSNTPSLARVDQGGAPLASALPGDVEGVSGPLRVVYLGLMEEARGVGTAIEAVAMALRQEVPVQLELIGDGRSLEAFRQKASELGLTEEAVRFHGFLPYEQALRVVGTADVGLVPHYANESWQTTIPNKLFDYMSLGLPVISSDVTPVKRLLSETGAGEVFADRDPADLARLMGSLSDATRRSKMGRAGSSAIRNRYHWEQDAERLQQAIVDVVAS